jgi:hypothetical protein
MNRRHLFACLVCASTTFGAACGQPATPTPTATQTLTAAMNDFDRQTSFHLAGSVTTSTGSGTIDATISGSDSSGVIEDASSAQPVYFTLANGKGYLQGFYWDFLTAGMNKFLSGRWLTSSTEPLAAFQVEPMATLKKLLTRPDLEDAFFRGMTPKARKIARVDGVSVVELTSSDENLFVTNSAKPQLLEIDRPAGAPSRDGFNEVKLSFSQFGTSTQVSTPPNPVDLNEPTQLPARYTVNSGTFELLTCDQSSCGGKVTVTNVNGQIAPDPPATITVTISNGSHVTIDSCTANIPLVANKATAVVSCTVSSQAWRNFAYNGGSYYGAVALSNPLYA